jgi:hypothetical protein
MAHKFGLFYNGEHVEPGWFCVDVEFGTVSTVLKSGASMMEFMRLDNGGKFFMSAERIIYLIENGLVTFHKINPLAPPKDPNILFKGRQNEKGR